MLFAYVMGNLGKDAETRITSTGQKVTTFSVAARARKNREDVTIWVRVTVWGDRISEKMLGFLKKGAGVVVSGQLSYSTYIDKEGKTQVSLEMTAESVNFNPFGKGERAHDGESQTSEFTAATPYAGSSASTSRAQGSRAGQESNFAHDIDEDTLPF